MVTDENKTQAESTPQKQSGFSISLDWWSVIIGLALVVLIWARLITSIPW